MIGWNYQEPKDGGKGSHQAIVAALLGAKTSFVGCVGQDRLGDEAVEWLLEAGVDISYLERSPTSATGIGFIMLDDQGIPAMVSSLGANAELNEKLVEKALSGLHGARIMLTQFEIRPEIALFAAQTARQFGMLSVINPAPAVEVDLTQLGAADILVPNESEAKVLLGLPPDACELPLNLARRLQEKTGAQSVLVTIGEEGVAATGAEGNWTVKPPKVKVVDTSGAGDVFCGALAVGLVDGKPLREASAWACQAAALSVEKSGTIPSFPTRRDLELRFGQG